MICRRFLVAAWFCLAVWARAETATEASESAAPLPPGRARVLIAEDPEATKAFSPNPAVIRRMFDRALTNLTAKPTPALAWRALVATQDVVGLKVVSSAATPGSTHLAVAEVVVQSLLAAGQPASNIVIWDRQLLHLRTGDFDTLAARLGVRLAAAQEAGYDTNEFYESSLLGQLVYGDLEFGRKGEGMARRSYVSKLLTKDLTKIVNLTPLLNHNVAGVSGCLYNLAMGSADNTLRFTGDAERLASAVPDIYNLPPIVDHAVLHVVDALVVQYLGEERSLLHYSSPLNQIRLSRDPVALDVLSLRELELQREALKAPLARPSALLYENAALLELGIADPRRIQAEIVK